jgi:hypothetical protein
VGHEVLPVLAPFADGDTDALGIPVTTLPFLDTVAQGLRARRRTARRRRDAAGMSPSSGFAANLANVPGLPGQ